MISVNKTSEKIMKLKNNGTESERRNSDLHERDGCGLGVRLGPSKSTKCCYV